MRDLRRALGHVVSSGERLHVCEKYINLKVSNNKKTSVNKDGTTSKIQAEGPSLKTSSTNVLYWL